MTDGSPALSSAARARPPAPRAWKGGRRVIRTKKKKKKKKNLPENIVAFARKGEISFAL